MKKILIALLALSVILTSCSSKVPFTTGEQTKYKLSDDDVKSLQFYTMGDIVITNGKSDKSNTTEDGELVIKDEQNQNKVIIPSGTRGVGLYRAQAFGKKFEDYVKWVEEESVVIVQIEHIDAVQQIDEIFSVSGIDAYMIGPYDLSGSLNKPGKFDDPEVKKAIETIIQAGKKYNIPAGFHSVSSNPNEAFDRQEQGFIFLAFSTDAILLADSSILAMKQIKAKK